ncbi:MAG TPA: glycosyltransferase [Alphaproteobacteria bacterium]|nr:glycosyltransferase [Alphaproteobacteria bacterium]
MGFFAILSALSLAGWLYLTFAHGKFWQPLFAPPANDPAAWPSVDIIVPARDEAASLPRSLPSLLEQDYKGAWRIILVDDHSSDGTGDVARKLAAAAGQSERLTVIAAPDLKEGWSGKVAAMDSGVAQSRADFILFADADIRHAPRSLTGLVAGAEARKLDLASRMVTLHCASLAEKFLIPAFVFFFAMLYPFARANDPDSGVAAAAGGAMLVRRTALDNIGGLARIKSKLIDDCALARVIKDSGGGRETPGRIELALIREIESLRVYPAFGDVRRMIARTAFTQLCHSPLYLAGTLLGMGLMFLLPMSMAMFGSSAAAWIGATAWFVMGILYMPMVIFYRLSPLWAFTLPAAALFYMGATIDSARLYWQGKGGQWKGRSQA